MNRYDSLSIGDTCMKDDHELMWDGGQWVHSPDCREGLCGDDKDWSDYLHRLAGDAER